MCGTFEQTMKGAFTPKKAVSYLRVSSRGQAERGGGDDEGFSIPAQREGNKRKAAALCAFITKEFVDRGASAKSADRGELQKMLVYIKETPVDYVIVNKVDRLARNREDDIEITRAIKDSGAVLVSATENIDGESPQNMLLHGIMASIAEFYSQNLATEVKKGMSQKAKSGGTPGMAPIGYLNVQDKDEQGRELRYVIIDEERAPLVKLAFEYYATGDWVASDLAEDLATRGLATRPTPRKPAKTIDEKMLYGILANPYYKGIVTYMGAQYVGKHEPLVDAVTWQKVQDVLASHRNGERTRVHNHFLKSTLYCGICGSRMIVHNAKSGSGVYYPYFVCVTKHAKKRCPQHAVLIAKVEEAIEKLYDQISLTSEYRKLLQAWLFDEADRMNGASNKEIADLEKQQKRLKDEEAKLLQAHYAEAVSLELMQSEQKRISKTQADFEAKLHRLQVDAETVRGGIMQVLDLMQDCGKAYRLASDYGKRLMNQAMFEKISVNPDGSITPDYTEIVGLLIDPELRRVLLGSFGTTENQAVAKLTAESGVNGETGPESTNMPTLAKIAAKMHDIPLDDEKPAGTMISGLSAFNSSSSFPLVRFVISNFFNLSLRNDLVVAPNHFVSVQPTFERAAFQPITLGCDHAH